MSVISHYTFHGHSIYAATYSGEIEESNFLGIIAQKKPEQTFRHSGDYKNPAIIGLNIVLSMKRLCLA
jgi:hypothetical protein